MRELNEDVLRHVVRYISSDTLDRINSCHPIFYEEWMKARYATLVFSKRDKEMKRLFEHLREPHVAMHVKHLIMRPWLVQPRTKSPRSRTENLIVRFLELLDPHYTKKKAEQRLQKRLRKDITNVTTAFQHMTKLEDYSLEWDDSRGFHPEFYKEFLAPALESWSSHLLKLSLKVPPAMLSALGHVRLPKLETLVFHFSTSALSSKDIDSQYEGFVVFVNNLKDSLSSLSLLSSNTCRELDISRMFSKLGSFPALRKVALSIPFDGAHLSDPQTFVKFLEKHRLSIKELDISATRCTPRSTPGDPEYHNWVQRIIGSLNTPFPHLSSLGLALRPLRAPLDVLIRFLDMHSSTLDTLKLTDRVLSVVDLREIFLSLSGSALIPTITSLQVKMDEFSATSLAQIALLFQDLKSLKIECAQDPSRQREVNIRKRGVTEFSANLKENHEAFRLWNLQHLAIAPSEYHWARIVEKDLMGCMPDLTITDFDV
ncbi:hypothetical protein CVT26_010253 [Gymnopilus dilepis]|uniref:F-box domain-containing protein n=1 Tax=Gymnopilus dilepis TaxID=231916 RepID=A0A409Y143_9AGAR|nr:hypothetical protein CVT26_010253 [Gymnopilus dilepis]